MRSDSTGASTEWDTLVLRTVAVCSHDDDGENELQHSQGKANRSIRRYVHGHDLQRSLDRHRLAERTPWSPKLLLKEGAAVFRTIKFRRNDAYCSSAVYRK